jgi:hypothetical protein
MVSWTTEQLARIAATEELQITTPGRDTTMRSPIPIWVVRHGDALYVRSYRGEDGVWYRSVTSHGRGHISAGGIDTDITFAQVTDADVNAEIDAAYRNKYGRWPTVHRPYDSSPCPDNNAQTDPRYSNERNPL